MNDSDSSFSEEIKGIEPTMDPSLVDPDRRDEPSAAELWVPYTITLIIIIGIIFLAIVFLVVTF